MRVLMLVSEAPPIKSGIARVTERLTHGLRDRGVYVDVISANEVPRWAFKEFRLSSLALHWSSVQRKLADYDVLHVHGVVPTFSDVGLVFGRLGLRMSCPQVPVVYTHHSGIDIAGLGVPVALYNHLHRRLIRLADHVVASTPSYAEQFEDTLGPGRVSAIPFGVESDQLGESPTKPDRFNVLFVGQLRPYKGVDTLLQAWQKMTGADLHIVGDGHERARLESMAKELALESVHFHGSVSDQQLGEFYTRAHTVVLPSNRKAEAFGLVLLEGMAAGCVPIASDLPGVKDVVGTSGFTFPVGDAEALAGLLLLLRDDPERRRQMSVLASARAIAANWDDTAEAYEGVYRQAILGRQLELSARRGKISKSVLRGWLQEVAAASRAQRASLMMVFEGTRTMRIAASVGIHPDIVRSTRIPIGQRIAGFVAHTGRPMLVRRKGMPAIARLYRTNPQLGSSLILPLQYRDHPLGALNLARNMSQLDFSAADERWLHRLSLQIAPLLASHVPTDLYASDDGSQAEEAPGRIRESRRGASTRGFPAENAALITDPSLAERYR